MTACLTEIFSSEQNSFASVNATKEESSQPIEIFDEGFEAVIPGCFSPPMAEWKMKKAVRWTRSSRPLAQWLSHGQPFIYKKKNNNAGQASPLSAESLNMCEL